MDAFQPWCIQVLDSLDVEGNSGTKQDALSSQMSPVNRCLHDKASYGLDIRGESCLGCLD